MPISPIEATVRPITDPPKNATARALAEPCWFAATVVRTLALVAQYMPMNPAIEEHPAPTKNAMPSFQSFFQPTRQPMTIAKSPRITNSRFMKVIAPLWIVSPICATRPSPPDVFIIMRKIKPAAASPKTPIKGVTICKVSSITVTRSVMSGNALRAFLLWMDRWSVGEQGSARRGGSPRKLGRGLYRASPADASPFLSHPKVTPGYPPEAPPEVPPGSTPETDPRNLAPRRSGLPDPQAPLGPGGGHLATWAACFVNNARSCG